MGSSHRDRLPTVGGTGRRLLRRRPGTPATALVAGLIATLATLATLVSLIAMAPTAVAAGVDGAPDTAFGTSGLWRSGLSSPTAANDYLGGIAAGPNGTTLLAGTCSGQWCLARLEATGALDPNFGTGGIVQHSVIGWIYTTSTDSTGRIVAAGDCSNHTMICVGRFDAKGAPDPTFGTNGVTAIDVTAHEDQAAGLTIDPQGRIVVTGTCRPNGVSLNLCVARLTPTGALDTTFAGDGTFLAAHPDNQSASATGGPVVIAPDGDIVIAGSCSNWASQADSTDNVCTTRLLTDGTLDTTFDTDGWKIIDSRPATAAGNDFLGDLIGLPDGDLLTAAACDNLACLTRLNADGTLDTSFGTGGIATVALGMYVSAPRVIYDTAGRFVVVSTCNQTSVCLGRLLADGTVDTGFGTGTGAAAGTTIASTAYTFSQVGAVFDGSGRVVTGGTCTFTMMSMMPMFGSMTYENQPCVTRFLMPSNTPASTPVVLPPPPPPSTTTPATTTTTTAPGSATTESAMTDDPGDEPSSIDPTLSDGEAASTTPSGGAILPATGGGTDGSALAVFVTALGAVAVLVSRRRPLPRR